MSLKHFSQAFENEGLSNMKASKIGSAASSLIEADAQHDIGIAQKLKRLIQKTGRLWGQRSTPSRRISCIKGVLST